MVSKEVVRGSINDDATKTQLMDLQVDTLLNVLLRLPAKSICCIKCVSKTLLNMVDNISFSMLHTHSGIYDQVVHPRLLGCYEDKIISSSPSKKSKGNSLRKSRHRIIASSKATVYQCRRFVLSKLRHEDNFLTHDTHVIPVTSKSVTYRHDPRLLFVFYNLFFLETTEDRSYMLVNPLEGRGVLRLPLISFAAYIDQRSLFGMGYDDKTNTYKIVSFVCASHRADHGLGSMKAYILVLGANSWRQIPSIPPCYGLRHDTVCINGVAHWLAFDGKLVTFDFRTEEFFSTPNPPSTLQSHDVDILDNNYWKTERSIFSLGGCLGMASMTNPRYVRDKEMEVWLMEDESSGDKQWTRLYYNNAIYRDMELRVPREWEHGIFLTNITYRYAYVNFLDLRCGTFRGQVAVASRYPDTLNSLVGVYSYWETLICLRHYGSLEDASEFVPEREEAADSLSKPLSSGFRYHYTGIIFRRRAKSVV